MTPDGPLGAGVDPAALKQEMRDAAEFLNRPASADKTTSATRRGGRTSDLSIDEELSLHSVGWEPIQLVCGASLYSVPLGVWNWGQGEISYASDAYMRAFAAAGDRIHQECTKMGDAAWSVSTSRPSSTATTST